MHKKDHKEFLFPPIQGQSHNQLPRVPMTAPLPPGDAGVHIAIEPLQLLIENPDVLTL